MINRLKKRCLILSLVCFALMFGGVAVTWAQEELSTTQSPPSDPSVIPGEEVLPAQQESANILPVVDGISEEGQVADPSSEVAQISEEGAVAEGGSDAAALSQSDVQPMQVQKQLTQVVNDRKGPVFNRNEYPSMLFTFWEHTAISDARRARGSTRAPTESELMRDLKTNNQEELRVKPPAEEREIKLSGILYQGGGKWTIWLNGERVTPQAIPEEVMDLKVYNDYIEFKWFDVYTNRIFPIRLRPHQRFNIDTRIFLPG